ncbi:MAG TPA: MFS transporter [Gaiellaceae bacterium]|nr:MFS transporter [Gaiellaceae bacterium]
MRGLVSTYFPPLPRSVLTLQIGGLINAFGNGMVIPFMFIYLHNVRGIELGVAGLIVGAHAVVSIVAGPIFGSQIDRFGGKRMLALALAILTVGYAGYALVQEPWQGFLVAIVSGIGVGGFWPAQSTLITGLTPPDQRPSAFAMQRVVMNLGIGLGALTGGLIATTDSPGSFVALFLLDAATFLVYACVMLALVPEPDLHTSGHGGRTGSYREVLRHRPFVAVIALNALFIFAGFSGFDVLPVYAKNEAGLDERQIGLLFLVNTLVIVFSQLPIARLTRGRRRMPTLGLFGLIWAGAWLLVPLAGSAAPESAFLVLVVVMVAFAIGQCLHGAVAGPLAADLAQPRLMGRYMALNALSWQIGFALGPALGGAGLAVSPNGVWIAAAALCAVGAACTIAVEGALPSRARRNPLPAIAT